MRDFIILFKIRLKANRARNKKIDPINTRQKRIKLSILGRVLLILVSFSPMMILSWMGMSKSYPAANGINLVGGTLADAMLSNYIMFGGIMFILGFFPILIYNIVANDKELELLLTLPISRTTIFFTILAQILLYSIYPLLILLPSIFSYVSSLENNFLGYFLGTVVCLESILFALGISGLLALTIARGMKRKTANKLTMIITLINILMIMIFANLIPSSHGDRSVQAFEMLLQKFQSFSLSRYNPFYWAAASLKGNYLYLSLFTLATAILIYGLFKMSKDLEFENAKKYSKKKEIKYGQGGKSTIYIMVIKELKLIFREDQSAFMMLYPIAFPLVFTLFGAFESFGAMYISIMLSSTYCAMSTYGSFGYEKQISPYQLTFPIKKSLILISKTIAPTLIYFMDIFIVSLIFVIWLKAPLNSLLILPFSLIMLFEISLWAAKSASTKLISFNSYKEALRSNSLKINLLSMLMAQEVLVPFIFITYPKILGKFSWTSNLFYFIPIIFILVNAKLLFKNMERYYNKFEEI